MERGAGAWVACSEITRRAGKQTVVGAVLVGAVFGASAQNCPQAADGSYMAGDGPQPSAGCTVIPATSGQLVQSPTAGFYVLTRSNLRGPLTVGNANVKAYVNGGYGGIGNQYALGPAASIQTGNLTFDTSTTDNTTSIGSHSGVNITTADANIKAVMTYGGGNSTGAQPSMGFSPDRP
ncbi:hypothetical protein [Diaphorobacter aerolatus]|uniref:Uncharacterized protein n=1 Tax=Diaphorobacter aerolatus TaxID=1288495 RepID=A0A7H0GP29_9BURK|nr:hypothetical protein [Diaphorobacter aerolatus]QNP50045.1 hypothetical protein H9K75_09475 [Diaphorobacter aerolatus]